MLILDIGQSFANICEIKAIKKAAINMLKQNLDIKLIASVTGLSCYEIEKLKSKDN